VPDHRQGVSAGISGQPEELAHAALAIYLATDKIKLVVDTSPEFRVQCLREKINWLDAVVFTHAHADHIMGLDDCRRFCDLREGSAAGLCQRGHDGSNIKRVFIYAFDGRPIWKGYFPSRTAPRGRVRSRLGDLEIIPLPLPHGADDDKRLSVCPGRQEAAGVFERLQGSPCPPRWKKSVAWKLSYSMPCVPSPIPPT
jgi:phosphoribosyl 1,2-cyclic phosphodiesterase